MYYEEVKSDYILKSERGTLEYAPITLIPKSVARCQLRWAVVELGHCQVLLQIRSSGLWKADAR